jgi:hypothetical protein
MKEPDAYLRGILDPRIAGGVAESEIILALNERGREGRRAVEGKHAM